MMENWEKRIQKWMDRSCWVSAFYESEIGKAWLRSPKGRAAQAAHNKALKKADRAYELARKNAEKEFNKSEEGKAYAARKKAMKGAK